MSIGCLEVSIGMILGWNVGFVSCWPNSIPHGIFPQHNARVYYLLLACPVLYVSGKKSVCFSRIFGAHPLDLAHNLVESISFLSGKRIELLNPEYRFPIVRQSSDLVLSRPQRSGRKFSSILSQSYSETYQSKVV